MLVDQEVTFDQLRAAYIKGQRVFTKIEIAAKDDHLVISGTNLSSSEFIGCFLHSVKFRDVDFIGASFHECNLKCTVFENCCLTGSSWKDSAVCSIVWRDCVTENVRATGLEAYGVAIEDSESLISYATDKRKSF